MNSKGLINPIERKADEDGKVFCSECGEDLRVKPVLPLHYDVIDVVCVECGHWERNVSLVRIFEVQPDE